MPGLTDLKDLMSEQTKLLLDGESQQLSILPQMALESHSGELKKAILQYSQLIRQQRERLYQIFKLIDVIPEISECKGMRSFIQNSWDQLLDSGNTEIMDPGILFSVQHFNYYQIVSYRASIGISKSIGFNNLIAHLLYQTIDEKNRIDDTFSKMEGKLNNQMEKPLF